MPRHIVWLEMADIIQIDGKKLFTLPEARALLPVVRRVTQSAEAKVRDLGTRYSYLTQPEKKAELEIEIRDIIAEWQQKVTRLGLHTKGLWLVDFDNGDGFWCWQFPEPDVQFTHGYHEGFGQRRELPPAELTGDKP